MACQNCIIVIKRSTTFHFFSPCVNCQLERIPVSSSLLPFCFQACLFLSALNFDCCPPVSYGECSHACEIRPVVSSRVDCRQATHCILTPKFITYNHTTRSSQVPALGAHLCTHVPAKTWWHPHHKSHRPLNLNQKSTEPIQHLASLQIYTDSPAKL